MPLHRTFEIGHVVLVSNRIDDPRNPVWIGAPSLPASECSTLSEAKRALGLRRWAALQHRAYVGYLDKCFIDGGQPGVTKVSLQRELDWWRTASLGRQLRRRLREITSYF